MAHTGNLQAIIAYKVSYPGGEPLDVDGNPTAQSGKRQAIALAMGYSNPDPDLYEVETYFEPGAVTTGNPTLTRDTEACPEGDIIRLSADQVTIGQDEISGYFTLQSSGSWELIGSNPGIVDIAPISGDAGIYQIVAIPREMGEGYYTFRNTASQQTATILIINYSQNRWILNTGLWDMGGLWYDKAIWKTI